MKKILIISFLFLSITSFSQIVISGTVQDKNGPLEGAAVYLNNSMLGTTTNKNGKFELKVKDGIYELVISYLGYKKIIYPLNTKNTLKVFRFILEEEENELKEIFIKKTVYDKNWKENLSLFKKEFLGSTRLSKDCKIINENVLTFYYDSIEKKLEAFAKKPIQIKHFGLGYNITYELESFIRTKDYISFLGFSRYEEMIGNKKRKEKWEKNRLRAYNGSHVHFYKTLIKDTFSEEGFIVNQFKQVVNPQRPSDEEIEKAKKFLIENKPIGYNFDDKKTKKLTKLDSANIILRKTRLPKYLSYLTKSNLKREDIIIEHESNYFFNFNDNLNVIYTKEDKERGYFNESFLVREYSKYQNSSIIPMIKDVKLHKSGIVVNPLNVFYDGYWSYEKFANLLPLDYEPQQDKK